MDMEDDEEFDPLLLNERLQAPNAATGDTLEDEPEPEHEEEIDKQRK